MRVRWIHAADVHLGYQQYGLAERADDFARAFKHVCDHAIRSRVDFLLIAGDLFHKRAVDARTMGQAYGLLSELRKAGIPVLCVEGNHERAFYNASWTWLEFLSVNGLLHLLGPNDATGQSRLDPWDEDDRCGGYLDINGVRVYGIKYHGASAPRVLERVSNQLAAETQRPLSVVMLHEGMEGQLPRSTGGLTAAQLDLLQPHCEYLALGHIHKRYEHRNWAHNPGSLETCSTEEWEWERGYYEVEADTDARQIVNITHHTNPRRHFHRIFIGVEACSTPGNLEETVLRRVESQVMSKPRSRPVIDVTLRGTLQFGDDALRLPFLEEQIRERCAPMVVRIKNNTVPAGYSSAAALDENGQLDRRLLEVQVLTDLLRRDSRYEQAAGQWALTFQEIKDAALTGVPPAEVVRILEAGQDRALSASLPQ